MTNQKTIKPTGVSAPISVRLTDEERTQLKADARGMSLSGYIRKRLFSCEKSEPMKAGRLSPVERQRLLASILQRLGQSNIAPQISKLVEAAQLGLINVSPEFKKELLDTRAEIRALRHDLLIALGLRPREGDE